MPDSNIKIISLNCQGLASKQKRQDIFTKLKHENNDIILLQDVHWDPTIALKINKEWGYKMESSPYTTQAGGTAILFNNSFEFSLGDSIRDTGGNYTLVELILSNNLKIVIGSVYGPNNDNTPFFNTLGQDISKFENSLIILGGDWNSTRNFKLVNMNYVKHNNPNSVKELNKLCDDYNLVDAWRINNIDKKQFTWIQGISNKQARLDYFLITEELLSITSKNNIETKYRSDHAPISIQIELCKHTRGPGTWKFNNSLLMNEDFIKLIKKEIVYFKLTCAATPYNQDYISSISHNFELMINPSLFWETLLVTLRGTIIGFTGKQKREQNKAKKKLEEDIANLDNKINTGSGTIADYARLNELNNDLIEIRKRELEGTLIRSRADWLEY